MFTLVPDDKVLGSDLAALIRRAARLIGEVSGKENSGLNPEDGLISNLQACARNEAGESRRFELENIVQGLKSYFRRADPGKPHTNNGIIIVETSADGLHAYLALIPPRGIGNMPTINMVTEAMEGRRVIFGINNEMIDRALATMREKEDVVWGVVIADGAQPVAPESRKVKYSARVVDKAVLKNSSDDALKVLTQAWEPVKEGQRIGFVMDAGPGTPGRDVFGRLLPPPAPPAMELGADVVCSSDSVLTAASQGYVIADGNRIDIVPLYVISDSAGGISADITFSGAVLAQGNLNGPGNIECDDLFVVGNCEQIKVVARGDVFITGGIIGHNKTEIAADGGIYCSFASEAMISALGEVVVANAIINSEVVSSDIIKVTSPKGMIAGGRLHSLRELSAATIGSEFGMMTQVFVGKDFLTPTRLGEILARISMHEENLSRIQQLKNEMSRSRVQIENLPRDKQEIYIGILRKERNSLNELKSLMRRRDILQRALGEFLAASVKVLNSIYPPSRIQILDAISDVKQKLNAVILRWGKQGVVMTDMTTEAQKVLRASQPGLSPALSVKEDK